MLFVELRFFFVFAVAFAVYWSLRSDRWRKLWLLAVSYFVYGSWDWRYLLLILASTVLDWFAGNGAAPGKPHRKAWLWASLVGNLGMLGFFKYYNFFVESGSDLLRWLGFGVDDYTLAILLPVGISFYTFQTLSYTIDIYRGKLEPSERFTDLALFVAFFPQLVAGPIVRAVQFMPQLTEKRTWAQHVPVRSSLAIFLYGFVKKSVVSDQFAPIIDQVFSDAGAHDSVSVWIATLLFQVQVYCDFSGYSDMAIGLAGLLGYSLPRNFLFPYFARSFTNFWQRWHMTLGAWFMDYIYFPMGGSRGSLTRTRVNLFTIFLISGLWHGAAWTFVIFGICHGLFAVVERGGFKEWLSRAPLRLGFVYTNVLWLHTMTIFRADDMHACAHLFGRMYGFGADAAGATLSISRWWALAALGFFVVHAFMYKLEVLERSAKVPVYVFAALYGLAWALVIPWIASDYTPFIYFQF
ncbi:MAG: MBOAT family protein [Planctomycetes bacterium]|nr:MBOAT family protein [Planctomycetota bacterium]